jgi:hypothetical protein
MFKDLSQPFSSSQEFPFFYEWSGYNVQCPICQKGQVSFPSGSEIEVTVGVETMTGFNPNN